jgi:hypothetical protein
VFGKEFQQKGDRCLQHAEQRPLWLGMLAPYS